MNGLMNRAIAAIAVAILMAGCAESTRPQATGEGTLRTINAAVTTPGIAFLLEERLQNVTGFKSASAAMPWDDLEYLANFEYQFVGDVNSTRLLSIPFTMQVDTDFLFVFTGSLAQPDYLLWESPNRAWEGTETVFEAWFGHLSPQLGEVDIYFGLTGTLPVLGEQKATLTNGNRSAIVELEAGEYEVTITTRDDPTDILYQSAALEYGAGVNFLFALFDTDPSITAPIALRVIQASGSSIELPEINTPPTLRAMHLAFGTVDFDLYRDNDFTAPLIAGATFGVPTAEQPTPPGSVPYSFNEASVIPGVPGTLLLEDEFAVNPGRRVTRFLIGDMATLVSQPLVDDIRPIADIARVRFYQTSVNQNAVDIYIVFNGIDIENVGPRFFAVPFQANTGYVNLAPNDYQIYATPFAEKTVLAGPFDVTMAEGDIVHFALADTADPAILEWIKYDHLSATVP